MKKDAKEIKKAVRERYAGLARQKAGSCCPSSSAPSSSCCAPGVTPGRAQTCAEALYTKEELETLPKEMRDISWGCGNPTAIAELRKGEVVLDLGSGGGLDCFLAAQKVGAKGKVIGLDMTPEMVSLARENAKKMGISNVEFRLGEMEHMPLEANSVDVIISNCVINLSPDKDAVFREAFRVLKPGGRLCVSDIVLLQELPPAIKESLDQWAGCVAGALDKNLYLDKLRTAGFVNISTEEKNVPLLMERGTTKSQDTAESQNYLDLSGKIASINVRAFKAL
jgi:arsenite methyltransferase